MRDIYENLLSLGFEDLIGSNLDSIFNLDTDQKLIDLTKMQAYIA